VAAGWYWARGEVRRGWRSTLLLVLLIGLAGGAFLTAVAGARRSSTAYDRFRQETFASDLDVAILDGSEGVDIDVLASRARRLPGVAAIGRNDYPFVVPAGSGAYPYLDFLAVASRDDATRAFDVPRVVEGRMPDPEDPHEVSILDTYAEEAGLAVGDQVEFESYAPGQMDALFTTGDAGSPTGPHFTFTVTGVLDAPIFLSESSGDFVPRMFLSSAFLETYGPEVAVYRGGFSVRLVPGTDVAEFTKALRARFEETPLEITPASEVDQKIDSAIKVIVTALLLTAIVAGLAGFVAVSQAIGRHVGSQEVSVRGLSALGATSSERAAAHLVTIVPAAVLGAVLATVTAAFGSQLMPLGVARRAEPDPGIDIDVAVLGLGGLVVGLLVLLLAWVAATRASRLSWVQSHPSAPASSRAMRAVRRTQLAPSATTGIGMALEPRRGQAWAVRSALMADTLGAHGLMAVVVFIGSLAMLVRSPARYGAPFDAQVSGFTGDVLAEGGDDLLADPDIKRAGLTDSGVGRVAGEEVNTYVLESLKGQMGFTMLEGHAPRAPAEVALGARTLEHAGLEVGDEVVVRGASNTLRATVVGTAVFPVVDERSSPGRGVLMRPADFERIASLDEVNSDVVIDWADGVDVAAANVALARATDTEVFEPRLPSDVNNLEEVQSLPRALAVFLAVLAVLALVHALVVTVRLGRKDLAVLHALGFERRQLGSILIWQASTIGLIGLVVVTQLGVVVGRFVWRTQADSIDVVNDPVTPALTMLAVAVVAFAFLVTAALLPSRGARRIAPARVLRSG
jgi:ABC-type lipoprotein release transport system permease subunit